MGASLDYVESAHDDIARIKREFKAECDAARAALIDASTATRSKKVGYVVGGMCPS